MGLVLCAKYGILFIKKDIIIIIIIFIIIIFIIISSPEPKAHR